MTVYIVQEVLDRDGTPVYDTSSAAAFGERVSLYQMLGHSEVNDGGEVTTHRARTRRLDGNFFDEALDAIKSKLANYNPDEDYILPIGAIKLVAAATAIAARKGNGWLRLLVWDDWQKRYDPVEMTLWDEETAVTRVAREYMEAMAAGGKVIVEKSVFGDKEDD